MTDSSHAPDAPIDPAIEAALVASREARIESLLEIARIPSVSALHEHAPDMVATAEWIADRLRGVGATEVEVISTDLHPIVYGRIHEAPGAPTVIVYCHYDVQPVDPLDLWEHPPFEPFVRDGRFIGRGVADDKGQLVMHLNAIEALRAVGRAPAVNITFLFEGEEEYGSQSLETWIAEHGDRLAADAVVISDTGFFEGNVPAITVGLRGMMYAQIDVELSPVDLHSGAYGGAVHNPANALASIIASLKGSDGRIRIPGFYDDVVALTAAERAAMAALPFDDEAFRASIPVPALVGEAGWSTLERKSRPPDPRRQRHVERVPGRGRQDHHPGACARQDLGAPGGRPGPGQDLRGLQGPRGVGRTGRRHGHHAHAPRGHAEPHAHGPPGDTRGGPGPPRRCTASSPVLIREGGSIPVTAVFEHDLGLPVVLLGFAQPA